MEQPEIILTTNRRVYNQPVLTVFGVVKELTQSTGTNLGDGGPNMMTSDRSAKQDIFEVGKHPLGIGLYTFDYKPEFRDTCGHGRQFGVMADEVETVMPEAVSVHANGYKQVNYGMLGISRGLH